MFKSILGIRRFQFLINKKTLFHIKMPSSPNRDSNSVDDLIDNINGLSIDDNDNDKSPSIVESLTSRLNSLDIESKKKDEPPVPAKPDKEPELKIVPPKPTTSDSKSDNPGKKPQVGGQSKSGKEPKAAAQEAKKHQHHKGHKSPKHGKKTTLVTPTKSKLEPGSGSEETPELKNGSKSGMNNTVAVKGGHLAKARKEKSPEINGNSKHDDKRAVDATNLVYQQLDQYMNDIGLDPSDFQKSLLYELPLKKLVEFANRAFPGYLEDKQLLARLEGLSSRPDCGIIILERKSNKKRYILWCGEMKTQGTNDKLIEQGKKPQALGNGIERTGKFAVDSAVLCLGQHWKPFMVFCTGCDFSYNPKQVKGESVKKPESMFVRTQRTITGCRLNDYNHFEADKNTTSDDVTEWLQNVVPKIDTKKREPIEIPYVESLTIGWHKSLGQLNVRFSIDNLAYVIEMFVKQSLGFIKEIIDKENQ
jgi:hypothetical protein